MERVEFSYREEYSKPVGIILRPIAKVLLRRSNGEWVSQFMYVDSVPISH